ncbi:FimV/HubP family polar landmark protein [Legionella waltersii]|uniref:FimV/HubP family polar landmark protein n=1 Tax=Legionella waltersii TaxID=66969 RepID=UPI000731502A|nr:FimV/HubP family polar landmark protein [Legionella waltersii]
MKKTVLHAAILSLTMPFSLYGLGLGEMVVKSSLDQPFLAEIELVDVGGNSLSTIKVSVADPQQFEEIGLQRAAILSLLNFKIGKNSQGKSVIIIKSDERMTEPYMEIVIDLVWPSGQLYKSYTVLLDPPGYKLEESIAQSKPSYYKKKTTTYANEPGVVDKPVLSTVDHNPVNLNDDKKKTTYGPTVANENVWQIAQRYKTSNLILPQVVLAIVGANPEAFTNGNLNGLKVGSRLAIPSTEEIEKVPSDLAVEEVMAHDKAWTEKTEINHVLAPPYVNAHNVNPVSQSKNSEVPAVPKLNETNAIPKDSFPQIIQNITANPINTNTQNPKQIIVSQQAEQDAKTKAEISITTAAVETVRESNALLMEQLRLLQDQNKKLQDKLDQRDKELETLRKQIQVIMKERQSVASQASSSKSDDDSMSVWPFVLLFIVLAGGGYAFAYWYFRVREQKTEEQGPTSTVPEPNVLPIEQETLQPQEVTNVVRAVTSIVEQGSPEKSEAPKEEMHTPIEKEHPILPESTAKYNPKHPRPLASIIADKSVEGQSSGVENSFLPMDEAEITSSDELEFEPDTPDEETIEVSEVLKDQTKPDTKDVQQAQTKPEETEVIASPVDEQLEVSPPEEIASNLENATAESIQNEAEVNQDDFIEFESNVKEEPSSKELTPIELPLSKPAEDNEPKKEGEDNEELGVLEFETGLHEAVKEERKPSKKTKEVEQEEEPTMDIEFVSPLTTEGELSISEDKKEEQASNEEVSTTTETESFSEIKDTLSLETDLFATPDEKNESEISKNADDSAIQFDAGESTVIETKDEDKTASPLKSKKALDTLLDLAKTYISMGDIESAKGSLEEVIEHGSSAQKKEAKKLLKDL